MPRKEKINYFGADQMIPFRVGWLEAQTTRIITTTRKA
jgi:hypothetical protein